MVRPAFRRDYMLSRDASRLYLQMKKLDRVDDIAALIILGGEG